MAAARYPFSVDHGGTSTPGITRSVVVDGPSALSLVEAYVENGGDTVNYQTLTLTHIRGTTRTTILNGVSLGAAGSPADKKVTLWNPPSVVGAVPELALETGDLLEFSFGIGGTGTAGCITVETFCARTAPAAMKGAHRVDQR